VAKLNVSEFLPLQNEDEDSIKLLAVIVEAKNC
jgi:hypothetical protein